MIFFLLLLSHGLRTLCFIPPVSINRSQKLAQLLFLTCILHAFIYFISVNAEVSDKSLKPT